MAQSGEITTGELVTFLLISTRMTMPLFIFGILVNQLQRGEAALGGSLLRWTSSRPSLTSREPCPLRAASRPLNSATSPRLSLDHPAGLVPYFVQG